MSTSQFLDPSAPVSPHRQQRVSEAIRQWTDQLMDVSGRNQLLFYRDLMVGTLDLGDADPDALDALLRGRKSSISRLFSPSVVPDRLKRARAIPNKSVESLEERGIVTCYLTSGMATWQPQQGKPTPNAPVLLRAVTFTATDAALAAAATRDWRRSHPAWPGSDAGWGLRRRRVKASRNLWRGPTSPSKQQLHTVLQEANDLEHAWRGAAVDQRGPHEPASMLAAKGLFDQLRLELAALGAYVVGLDFELLDKAGLQSTIESLQSDAQVLYKMQRINKLNDEFVRAGLGPLIEEMKSRRLDVDLAGAVFQMCWHRSVLERITFEDQALANFQGTRHHELVSTFREADNEHVSQTAQRVRRAAAERLVRVRDEHEEQSTLVQAQAQRKRGHLPLRDSFRATAPSSTS